jgi:AP2 domain/HNH endonuclease
LKEIPLTQGKAAMVSDHRFQELSKFNWFVHRDKNGRWYAKRGGGMAGVYILMHRQILSAPDGMEVDHRDGDGLNNQDDNIRICSSSQNHANKGKLSNNTSGFKGVFWHKATRKWRAQIRVGSIHIHLGYFDNTLDAAKAYDLAALVAWKEFARPNLPPQNFLEGRPRLRARIANRLLRLNINPATIKIGPNSRTSPNVSALNF